MEKIDLEKEKQRDIRVEFRNNQAETFNEIVRVLESRCVSIDQAYVILDSVRESLTMSKVVGVRMRRVVTVEELKMLPVFYVEEKGG